MQIKKEDIETYEEQIEIFKRQFERENEGKVFTPVFNKKILKSIAEERERQGKNEREFERRLEEFIMVIDPKVKTELDLRLAKGEISQQEYEKVIRTLVWTNKAYLPPSLKRHLDNTGPRDPELQAAEREVSIRMQEKERQRHELGEIPVSLPDAPPLEEGSQSELEKAAKLIDKAKDQVKNQAAPTVIDDSIKETGDDKIIINNGMQLVSILKAETPNLTAEAVVVLQNIRQAYASINQGCGCTKNKRIDIAFENFKRNIRDLGEDLGIIEAVKRVSGKDRAIFSDDKGNIFLEG
jgi:hypothetical protein